MLLAGLTIGLCGYYNSFLISKNLKKISKINTFDEKKNQEKIDYLPVIKAHESPIYLLYNSKKHNSSIINKLFKKTKFQDSKTIKNLEILVYQDKYDLHHISSAISYFEQYSENNDPEIYMWIAIAYYNYNKRFNVNKYSMIKIENLLYQSEKLGNSNALLIQGKLYNERNEPQKAFQEFKKAAELENIHGLLYINSENISKNKEKAKKYLEISAKFNYQPAQELLKSMKKEH